MTRQITHERAERAPLTFSEEQRQIIRDSYANGASEAEFQALMAVAAATRLNPLLRQCYFVKRWDSQRGREVWAVQTSIDGFRAQADRTQLYAGQDEPEWVDDAQGRPLACKVRVYRRDWERPTVGVAYYAESVQLTKDGRPTKFWATMPRTMLAKVAESQALRRAFPEDTAGLLLSDETGEDEREARPSSPPAAVQGFTAPQISPPTTSLVEESEHSAEPAPAAADPLAEVPALLEQLRAQPDTAAVRRFGRDVVSKRPKAIQDALRGPFGQRLNELRNGEMGAPR